MLHPDRDVAVIRASGQAAMVLQKTRRALLAELADPDSASGLGRRLGLPRQRLNYHLRALEREGLVECVEERRNGNCTERILRASARSFIISPEALGTPAPSPDAVRDRFSASYLLATAAETVREVARLDARARTEGKRLSTMTLATEVRFASAAARSAFADELTSAISELAARYHDDRAPGGRRFRLVAVVHPAVSSSAATTTSQKEPSCQTPPQSRTKRTARAKSRSTSTPRRKTSGAR